MENPRILILGSKSLWILVFGSKTTRTSLGIKSVYATQQCALKCNSLLNFSFNVSALHLDLFYWSLHVNHKIILSSQS